MGELAVERVAVLGAGVMGGQIAALAANAGFEVDLLDVPDADGDPLGRVRRTLEALPGLRPPALHLPDAGLARIHPASLEDPAEALGRADWVIEAIVEELDVKRQLLSRVAPHLRYDAVLTSNTSGLSIGALAESLDARLATRFLGVHFFNPPRYMKLVELIPGTATDPELVAALSDLLRERLGKGVVRCRDTPNFIANRLGVFALLDALHRMESQALEGETVDAATGAALGRPRSATLRLCDLIGLDTLAHVAATAHDNLPGDPWRSTFAPPALLQALLEAGHLGAKSGAGFYRKTEAGLEVVSWKGGGTFDYRPVQEVADALPTRGDLDTRLDAVWTGTGPAAAFARAHLLEVLAYCAVHAGEVADGLEDVDRALRWGFNWEAGPFEILDRLGTDRVRAARAEAGAPVPDLWAVLDGQPVYTDGGLRVYDAGQHRPLRRSGPPTDAERLAGGEVLAAGDGVCLVYLGDGAAVLEVSGKLNTFTPAHLDRFQAGIEAEAFDLLVLTGAGANFSAGADLSHVLACIDAGDWDELETYVRLFQDATSAVRYASVPVVAAARGLALGGGCELCLAAAGRVVAAELRLGLVEARVGVVPAAGGCRELVRRHGAAIDAILPPLLEGWMSGNAAQAQARGLLCAGDEVRLDGERLLPAAVARARQLLEAGWEPATPQELEAAGPEAQARWDARLHERHTAGELSAHDLAVARTLVHVMTGGGEAGPLPEERLLELEREAFLHLCGTPETRARIEHMLRTGKPLRN